MRLLGVLLMIASFPIMFSYMIIQETDPATFGQLMEDIFCGDGERYNLMTSSGYRPGLTYVDMTCDRADGTSRDVTMLFFLLMGVSFIVPFFLGLMLTMRGMSVTRGSVVTLGGVGGAMPTIRIGNQVIDVEAIKREAQRGGSFESTSFNVGAEERNSLTGRLKELQDAFDAGLLTQIEYDAKRRQILRDFSEQ